MLLRRRLMLLLLASGSACSDPCSAVIGCASSPHVAVNGRLLDNGSRGVSGASIRLIATYADHVDSAATTSDAEGLFSVSLPASGSGVPSVSLRVVPPAHPGYLVALNDCGIVTRRGDGCLVNPLLDEPTIPFFQFFYRNDPSSPVDTVQLKFTPTGGAPLFYHTPDGPSVPFTDSFSIETGRDGIATLLPLGVWTGSSDPVIGDLTVDFRAPIGRKVLHGFQFAPRVSFSERFLVPRFLGPSLSYRFDFSDSATGAPLKDVELRFRRTSGVATRTDTFTIKSDSEGRAFFALVPLSYGTVIGDMSVKAAQRPVSTETTGMMLSTFDQDVAPLFAAWRVGATGILYQQPAGGR